MPHLNKDRKYALRKNVLLAENPGDLNFLITLVILQSFKAHPRYERIHVLRRDFVTDPKKNNALNAMRREFADRFSVADIYTASALAFEEFYRLVGSKYEDIKIKDNGIVEEYQEVLDLINGTGEIKCVSSPSVESAEVEKAPSETSSETSMVTPPSA